MSRRERRSEALRLMQELVESWAACKAQGRPADLQAQVNQRSEKLLAFLLTRFPGEIEEGEINKLISEDRPVDLDLLDSVSDSVVPLAVMRSVMRKQRVLFSHKLAEFKMFSERYLAYLLRG